MRIWILSEFFNPYAENAIGYYVKGIAEKLAVKENIFLVFPYKKNLINKKSSCGVEIYCIRPIYYNRDRMISRLLGHLIMSFQFTCFLLFRIEKDDKILCFTQPVFLVLVCSFLKKIRKIKTIVVVHDLFPECLIGSNITNSNWFYRIVLKVFNKSYRSFDTIISIGKDMTQLLKDKMINNQLHIITIPNWTDINEIHFQDKKNNKIISKYNLEAKIVFTYAGTIGRAQGINNLIRLIEQIDFNNEIHFLFIGKGVATNLLTQNNNKIGNMISYAGYFPEEDKKVLLNACDVAIISLLEGMKGVSVPSKTYNILATGHPILFIGDEESEIATLVKQHDIGWVCNSTDSKRFKKIINEILSAPLSIKIKGEKARYLAEKSFSKDLILNKYLSVFEKLNNNFLEEDFTILTDIKKGNDSILSTQN